MTTRIGGIVIDIDARLSRLEKELAKARRETRRFQGDMRGWARSLESTFSGIGRNVGLIVAGFVTLNTVRGLARLADDAKNLEAQLRLATARTGSFAVAQRDVQDIAQQTRSGLVETAQLYAAFQRNAGELGLSQEQVARITRTVSEAFKVSGSSAEESAQGTRQLVQAFQSGVLRGDEFNSIMENAPRLARLLADSLGVPIGSLRQMAQQGELTADKLATAFSDTRFTATLDAEFRDLPVTFDQAMTQIRNTALTVFGAFDRGGQFSTALANFFSDAATGFGGMERDAEFAGASIRADFAALVDVFAPMEDGATRIFGNIGEMARSLAQEIHDTISAALHQVQNAYNAFVGFGNRFNFYASMASTPAYASYYLPGRPGYMEPAAFADRYDSSYRRRLSDLRSRQPGFHLSGGGGFASYVPYGDGRPRDNRPTPAPTRVTGGGGGGRGRARGSSTTRQPTPAELRLAAADADYSAYLSKPSVARMPDPAWVPTMQQITDLADQFYATLGGPLPDLSDMLPEDEQHRLLRFALDFRRDLTDGLADAIVFGDDLGDALVNSIKRAAAELISSSLFTLLTGGTFGSSMLGGLLGIGGKGGASIFATGAMPKHALGGWQRGGWALVGEDGPEIAPLGPGNVVPNHRLAAMNDALAAMNDTPVIEIVLRDELLDARIVRGSAVVVRQAAPGIAAQGAGMALKTLSTPRL